MLACVLVATPIAGSAQDLTVDGFVAMALERSPSLSAARTEVEEAREQTVQTALRRNPMVGFNRQEMIDGPDNQTVIEAEWPLDLFRRGARQTTAQQSVNVTALSVADRERLLAASVREQAGRVLEARRTLGVLEDVLKVDREMRDVMEARVREGAARPLDLDILRVEVQRAEAQVALQHGQADAAFIELKAMAGVEPAAAATLVGDLESLVRTATPPAEGGAGADVDSRPDVREALARVTLADTRLESTRREGRFDASIVGDYARMNASFPQHAFDDRGALVPIRGTFNNVRLGVVVTVPIFDRNQGSVASASVARQRAGYEATASRLGAMAEVAVAEAREAAARRAVELYGTNAREQARRNLEVVRESYQLGSATLLDVLAEQRRYLEVESAYTEALAEAYQARTALRRAKGDVR